MALQLKADVNDIPSILKLFGLGGMPAAAEDTGGAPPVDASLGGEAQPTAAPDTSSPDAVPPVPPDNGTSPLASTHDETKPPTKLLRLQQALGADQSAPVPPLSPDPNVAKLVAMSQGHNPDDVPDAGPIAPRSLMNILSGVPAPAVAPPKPTFQEKHPTLSKILGAVSNFVEDAGPGIGAPTFGQGFQTAAAQPGIRAKAALENQKTQAEVEQAKAKTAEIKSHAEDIPVVVNGVTYYIPKDKSAGTVNAMINSGTKKGIADQADATKRLIGLRKQGLKEVDGKPVPLEYEDLSPVEQAHLDLQQSQQEAAAARAEVERNKNNPNSPAYKAAMGRLQVAAKNAETAAGRLGLAKDTFNANYFGTGPDGQALPGAPTDENGKPIGPRVANAGKPSADRLKRGDLAANAIHNLNNVEEIIGRRGDDLFGPIMGRIANIRDMVGSDDPDLAAIGTEIHNYALASNGAHGVRSQQAVEKTEDEILKQMKRGTNGALGGIRAAKDSLLDFVKDQQLGNRARPQNTAQPKAQTAPDNAQYEVYAADGKTLIGHTVNGKYVPLGK